MAKKKSKSKGTALITGGAVRVGKEIALHLAKQGYDIALHYHTSKTDAKQVEKEIRRLGRECNIFEYNLGNINEVHTLAREVNKTCNNWNVLVNNASVFERFSFLETDEDIFNRHFNINFKAPFFLAREFSRAMYNKKNQNANIINITDTHITHTHSPFFAYLLSKKALFEFTQLAAAELGPSIRVNAIAPGIMVPSDVWGEGYIQEKKKKLPLKKNAAVGDLNRTISYILDNEYITGECFFVDGGERLI